MKYSIEQVTLKSISIRLAHYTKPIIGVALLTALDTNCKRKLKPMKICATGYATLWNIFFISGSGKNVTTPNFLILP